VRFVTTTRWVDAIEHLVNHEDEVDAKWLKLHRPETDATGEWFFLGLSLDKNKALMVKENELGALGKMGKLVKIWDNEGADTNGECRMRRCSHSADFISYLLERQTIWDLFPAKPEDYVSLGSYFESTPGNRAGPPPSFKTEPLKHIRAVRKDLVVDATLGENPVSLYTVCSTERSS
jgi:hypothetical protein